MQSTLFSSIAPSTIQSAMFFRKTKGSINWNVGEINLKDYDTHHLPDSPICRILVKLFLQVPSLTVIPPTFFEHMPVLEVLDLSHTNLVSLPKSISSLSNLQEFFLRDCSTLLELPTDIGMLSKLKLFDIKGTEIMFIPKEMGKLKDLEVLRVSLSQYAKYYIQNKRIGEDIIPRKMISELKKLKELCISVPPEAEWWEEEVKDIQNELSGLENLETLTWYLPTNKVLQQFLLLERNHSPIYANLSNFVLTIGKHPQLTSCLPRGLEKRFGEFKKCLKWINAEGSVDDISNIMARTEALFLSRHWTIKKLSTLNVTKLKYCLLAECNEMETLVEADDVHEDVETRINNGKNVGLELLEYLSIHYMNKLQSIWKGPIDKDSLSKLRILALHTCPHLTSIFSPNIAQNLSCLTELTVEDCPKVRSLISIESENIKDGPIFPSLKRIFLLHLPELVSIFDNQVVLEKLLIYNCLKLRYLSITGLPNIKTIEGEIEWWNALDCERSQWESIFVPLKTKRDLVEQLIEATNFLEHFVQLESEDNESAPPSGQAPDTASGTNLFYSFRKWARLALSASGTNLFYSFREWARLALSKQETEDDESNGWSRFKASYIASETDLFYSFREMVSVVGSRQETEDNKSYDWSHSNAPDTKTGTEIFYSFGEVDRFTLSGQGLAKMISLDKIDSFGTRVVDLGNTADKNVEEKMEEVMRAGEDNAQMISIMDLVRRWLELISITEKIIILKMGIEPSSFRVLKWIVIMMVQKYVPGILKNMYIK